MNTLFSPRRKYAMGEEDEEEPFRGGLLSPGPSASAPSVKNDDASFLSETNPKGNDGDDDSHETESEESKEDEVVANRSETSCLPPSTPGTTLAKTLLQIADIAISRTVSSTPRLSSTQTPFRRPSSAATMRVMRTPSSRSIASSSFSTRSTPAVRVLVKVHILALADRDKHPYHDAESKYTCTLKLMSNTRAKEVCLHAAEDISRNSDVVLDGTRFEARDREGYLFGRGEVISEEIIGGDPIYLIENAISDKGKGKEREDMARLQALERSSRKASRSVVGYRTPSLSSRTSSSVRKWSRAAKSEPRKTTIAPKAFELIQSQSVPRPPNLEKKPSSDSLRSEVLEEALQPRTTTTPAKSSTVIQSVASTTPRRKWTVRREPSADQQETDKDTLVEAVASQQSLPSPESSPAPQENTQLVIPDSQEDPPSPSPPPETVPVQSHLPTTPAPPPPPLPPLMPPKAKHKCAPQPTESQPCFAPPTTNATTSTCANQSAALPNSLPSRPDPYDIRTVLSDDENYSPRPSRSIMSSSFARKLGSASKRRQAVAPGLVAQSALSQSRLSSPTKAENSHFIDQTVIPSTPAPPTATPKRANASPPGAHLPSSPTNHVTAAIAKGGTILGHDPQKEAVVVYDSSDDADEDLLQQAPYRFSSSNDQSQPPEDLTHWDGPPKLELTQKMLDPYWVVRNIGQRTSIVKEEKDEDTKSQMRRLGELGGSHASQIESGRSKASAQNLNGMSPSKASSSMMSPPKKQPTVFAGRYPLGMPINNLPRNEPKLDVSKSPVIEVHGSSSESSDNSDERANDKQLSVTRPQSSPSKNSEVEIIVLSDTSSQYGSEDDLKDRNEDQSKPPLDNDSPLRELRLAEDSPVDHFPALLNQKEPELPAMRQETPPFSTAMEELPLPQPSAAPFAELPQTDPFVEGTSEASPPSAQPSKRKREPSEEPDHEEEERKKTRREARQARKIRRREEQKTREEKARLHFEEERKRLAMEQARLRAQKLEVIVSSPSKSSPCKAAELSPEASENYESCQESGNGRDDDQAPSTPESPSVVEPVVFEDGNNDSLSSRESEGRPSWRKLSKRHFSESPKQSQKEDDLDLESTHASEPSTSPAEMTPQEIQPESEEEVIMKPQYQRRIYDDWAFLEQHLGRNNELMDVHNRLHMQMVHEGIQQFMATGPEEVAETTVEQKASIPDVPIETKREEIQMNKKKKSKKLQETRKKQAQDDEAMNTLGSNRTAAPHSKVLAAHEATSGAKTVTKNVQQDIQTKVYGDGTVKKRKKRTNIGEKRKKKNGARKKHFREKRAGNILKRTRHVMKGGKK